MRVVKKTAINLQENSVLTCFIEINLHVVCNTQSVITVFIIYIHSRKLELNNFHSQDVT